MGIEQHYYMAVPDFYIDNPPVICCLICKDKADWGAWDMPEYAVCHWCEGCGGLLGVSYEW